MTLHRADQATPLVAGVRRAHRFRERLTGLLGRDELLADEGLWITPCNGVHSFGMRFTIDVLFLDSELRVVRTVSDLKPWRCTLARARSVVELKAGSIERLGIVAGDRLRLTPHTLSTNCEESLA